MRLYLPADLTELALSTLSPRPVSAVTPALRAALPEEDEEGLELSAFLTAADLSVLRLAGGDVPARRVVLALEIPGTPTFGPVPAELADLPSVVGLLEGLGESLWSAVVSIHADEPEAAEAVRAAFTDDDDYEELAEIDLLWFDPTERSALTAELG